jgi:hypothetical protein
MLSEYPSSAVRAPHIVNEMGAGVMFRTFNLMTSVAGDRLGLDFSTLCRVFLDIGDVPVAAITGICSMDRFGELGLIDIFMALQARGVVDTFQTVFPPSDLKLLLGQFKFLTESQFLGGTNGKER